MAERGELEAAADAGLIAREQIEPLFAFLSARAAGAGAPPPAPSGEEELRFIRNFHDLFLSIGIALFAIGLAVAAGIFAATVPILSPIGWLASAIMMWLLGEFFAGRRRLFLPAIAIVVCIAAFAATTFISALHWGVDPFATEDAAGMAGALIGGIFIASLAALAFYARFRLPFSLGLGAALLGWTGIAILFVLLEDQTPAILPFCTLGFGLALFAGGVWFDARDPARKTRFSDNGFWLHVAAAPFLLQGALALTMRPFVSDRDGSENLGAGALFGALAEEAALPAALTVLAVLFLFGLVSLLINRRALIVSGLVSFGIAVGAILNQVGLDEGALAAGTLICIGAFVLILGGAWHTARAAVLGWVKPGGRWASVFPPETARE